MNRVLMPGIDSMDSILLSRFEHKLPIAYIGMKTWKILNGKSLRKCYQKWRK